MIETRTRGRPIIYKLVIEKRPRARPTQIRNPVEKKPRGIPRQCTVDNKVGKPQHTPKHTAYFNIYYANAVKPKLEATQAEAQ